MPTDQGTAEGPKVRVTFKLTRTCLGGACHLLAPEALASLASQIAEKYHGKATQEGEDWMVEVNMDPPVVVPLLLTAQVSARDGRDFFGLSIG
jgi:hypothetical protein